MTRRRVFSIAAAVTVLTCVACSNGDGNGLEGTAIDADVLYPAQSPDGEQRLSDVTCSAGVLSIDTSLRTVRATVASCELLPPEDAISRFRDQPTEIEVAAGTPAKIFVRSDAAGSLEFTAAAVSVEER